MQSFFLSSPEEHLFIALRESQGDRAPGRERQRGREREKRRRRKRRRRRREKRKGRRRSIRRSVSCLLVDSLMGY